MERHTRLAVALAAAAIVVFTAVGATTHGSAPAPAAKSVHATEKHSAKSTAAAAAARPSENATRPWPELLQGNKRFVAGEHLVRPVRDLREELANGQHPDVIVLTCSDSRLSPEWIFDQTLGELFVVRTAGNVVDPIALGSIEYAVEHLHAKLIVVMGHDKCGAVSAALSGETMPTDNLDTIMRKIRPGIPPARTGASKDETLDAAVRANVRRSATDVVVASPIVREHVVQGSVSVVQAVYHLASGQVEELRTADQLSGSEHD
ncbi:MAG: carbonic anhydrase [Candidatus Eisenbacteria bacterium]